MRELFPDNTFVAPAIRPGSRLVIGEAPGQVEQELGEPLVGPTGSWLRGKPDEQRGDWRGGLFGKANIQDSTVSRANCIQCRPLNNVFPTDAEARSYISKEDANAAVNQCFSNHLLPVLRGRDWGRIDLLGDKALRIVGAKDGGILRWRGSPISIPALGDRIVAIPTLHPAGLARDQRMIPAVLSDLKKSLVVPPEDYLPHPDIGAVREFKATTFAFDIETDRATGTVRLCGLSDKAGRAICVPFSGEYLRELQRIFRDAQEIVGHNCLQFDMPRLRDQGVSIPAGVVVWDTMLMQHLLQPDMPHDLAFLGSIFTNKPAWKHLSGDDEELYCCRDVDVTWQCWRQLLPLLRAERLLDTYTRVSRPMASICLQMHQLGIACDPTRIGTVREQLKADMARQEALLPEQLRPRIVLVNRRQLAPEGTLSAKTGRPIKYLTQPAEETVLPWRSAQEVAGWLYGMLHLPEVLHAKTQRTTVDKTALERCQRRLQRGVTVKYQEGAELLRMVYPADCPESRQVAALQKLHKLDKLENTFCREELLTVDRVYPHFNVQGTSSGRLCLAPDTPVLYADLTWHPCSEVKTGDVLIGFDENATGPRRKLRRAVVGDIETSTLPCYKLTFSNGTSIVASENHGWLVQPGTLARYRWLKTKDVKVGQLFQQWRRPWTVDKTYEGGFLSGFLSGEGSVSRKTGAVVFSQNRGEGLEEILEILNKLNVSFSIYPQRSSPRLFYVYLHDAPTVLGRFRPKRLLKRTTHCWEGRTVYGKNSEQVALVDIQFLGERRVIGFETSSRTFLAAGLLSHNSSSEPNLQNIPESARYLYVPSHPTYRYLEVDYSQLENRLTAFLAQDGPRQSRLAEPGFSEHKWLAGQLFDIPYEEVAKDNDKDAPYGKAKRIGHGTNYGMGAKKISMLYDMDFSEVKALLDKWRRVNSATVEWQTRIGAQAKADGYLVNPFGRKRWFYTDSYWTESLSFLPQSTGADIMHRAAIGLLWSRIGLAPEFVAEYIPVFRVLPRECRLVLQVHDSFLWEFPGELADEVQTTVSEVMTQGWRELGGMSIPIDAKLGEPGQSWGELETL